MKMRRFMATVMVAAIVSGNLSNNVFADNLEVSQETVIEAIDDSYMQDNSAQETARIGENSDENTFIEADSSDDEFSVNLESESQEAIYDMTDITYKLDEISSGVEVDNAYNSNNSNMIIDTTTTLSSDTVVNGDLIITGTLNYFNVGNHRLEVTGDIRLEGNSELNIADSTVIVGGSIKASAGTIRFNGNTVANVAKDMEFTNDATFCGESNAGGTFNVDGNYTCNTTGSFYTANKSSGQQTLVNLNLKGNYYDLTGRMFYGTVNLCGSGRQTLNVRENSCIKIFKTTNTDVYCTEYFNVTKLDSDVTIQSTTGSVTTVFGNGNDALELNGHTFNIPGNYILKGGCSAVGDGAVLNIGGDINVMKATDYINGRLYVSANTTANIAGNATFTDGSDFIGYTDATINIDGDLLWNSTGNFNRKSSDPSVQYYRPILNIKGNYIDKIGRTFNGTINLIGTSKQTIDLNENSRIHTLSASNQDIEVTQYFHTYNLDSDLTLKCNGEAIITKDNIDLKGHVLNIPGNYNLYGNIYANGNTSAINVEGNMTVSTGSLSASADANVHVNGDLTFEGTAAFLADTNVNIYVGKDYTWNSNGALTYRSPQSMRPILHLGGNYTDKVGREFRGTVEMITPGTTVRADGSSGNGKINKLVLMGAREDFTIIPDNCYNTIECVSAFEISGNVLTKYKGTSEKVIIPSNVTEIGSSAFERNATIKEVIIPEGVKIIGKQAFAHDTSLESVSLPDSLIKIDTEAFNDCALKTIIIPKNVSEVGANTFVNCKALTTIDVKPLKFKDINGKNSAPKMFNGCTNVRDVSLPDGMLEIPEYIFFGTTFNNTTLNIPASVTKIGDSAFKESKGTLNIVFAENDNLTEIAGGAFEDSTCINKLEIPSTVKTIGQGAFWGATNLKSIVLPKALNSIGLRAFAACNSLEKVTLNSNAVALIGGYIFEDCKIKTLEIDSSVTKINSNLFRSADFDNCDIVIPKQVIEICDQAFMYAKGISSITFEEGSKLVKIGKNAFLQDKSTNTDKHCRFTAVQLPEGLKEIGAGAFADEYQFSAINKIIIPSTVTLIGENAFKNCATGARFYVTEGSYADTWVKSFISNSDNKNRDYKICKTCRIVYNLNGGTVAEANPSIFTLGEDAEVTINPPTRSGYVFNGWYSDKYLTKLVMDAENTTLNLTGATSNIALYAKWDAERYNLQFDANSGTISDSEKNKQIVFDSVYGKMPIAERLGYTFEGWYTELSDGQLVDSNTKVDVTGDQTLYAHWSANKYTVTFDSNGGTSVATIKATFDGVYDTLPITEKPYSVFLGWFTEKNGGEKITESSVVNKTSDHTLYAHWEYARNAETPEFIDECVDTVDSKRVVLKNSRVAIKCAQNGAKIFFTVDGTPPNPENVTTEGMMGTHLYEDSIVITDGVTIKAIAIKDGYNNSEIVSSTYEVKDESSDWGDIIDNDDEQVNDRNGFLDADKVPTDLWVRGIDEEVDYTGKAITFPDLRVYKGKTLLKANTDYTIKYSNNTKAGMATITVTGKGNYAGNIKKQFKINQLSLGTVNDDGEITNDSKVVLPNVTLEYNGKVQKVATTVSYLIDEENGKYVTLKNGTDYTLVYPNTDKKRDGAEYNPNAFKVADEYKVKLVGKGNYKGSAFYTETIVEKSNTNKKPISKLKFNTIGTQSLTGSEIKPGVVITDGSYTLVEGKDYILLYQNNINVGTATVVVTGIDSEDLNDDGVTYSGSKVISFKIAGLSMSNVKVTGLENFNYSKDYIEQSAFDEGTGKGYKLYYTPDKKTSIPMEKGVDYEVSYSGNLNASKKATIIFTGINKYSGVLKKTFTINPLKLTEENMRIGTVDINGAFTESDSFVYKKGGTKPVASVMDGETELVLGKDYSVAYSNNTKVHDGMASKAPTVKITGKGNYSGTLSKTFAIVGSSLENVSITSGDVTYQNKAGICKPAIKLVDSDGKALTAGTDYEKAITYKYARGVIVKQVVDAKKKIYNDIIRNEGDSVDTKDIIPVGAEITAKVIGKGNYPGEKDVTFRYAAADMSKATITVVTQSYTGKEIKPSKADIKVVLNKQTLAKTDYEIVGYSNNIAKGTAKVTIRGVGNYGGTKTANFNIAARSMNYTVVYVKNADDATGTMKNSVIAANTKVAANAYKRNGYSFTGWSTKSEPEEQDTIIKNLGALVLNDVTEYGSTVRLYAQWTPVVYTIKYTLNGGTNNADNPISYTILDDVNFVNPTKAGYTFAGWYLDSKFSASKKVETISAGTTGNKTLYAKWMINILLN